ncbi:response regulator [bacterium]|nr:response regulator [bacterium]
MEVLKDILVVQEESKLTQLIVKCLVDDFKVVHTLSILKAFRLLEERHFDLIILNTRSSNGNTIELCRRVKLESNTKVFFVSSCNDINVKELCFETGADDYVCTPFYPRELNLRIKRILNIYEIKRKKIIESRGLQLHVETKALKFHNCTVFLSPTEFLLLEYMIQHNRFYKTEGLLNYITTKKNKEMSNGALLVMIQRLREKLEKGTGMQLIKTRYGLGYYISL